MSAFLRRHKKPKRSGARSSPIRRPKELSYSTTRKIYNNKGTIVEQYEPFFDKGFDFSTPLEVTGTGIVQGAGVSVKLFYDPLGRVIRTVNPDSSEQWVLYGIPNALNTPGSLTPSPWESYTYDANDLAPLTNPSGSNVPGSHWYTPKNAKLDALGRTVLTREFFDNSDYSNTIDMQYRYDIRGNLLVVKDPYSRVVFEHVYDLRPPQKGEDGQQQPLPPLRTLHIDKGLSTVLFDASGKPVESHDAKGAQTLSAYDVISRPAFSWAKNKTGGTITLRGKTIYGEGHGVAVDNLKGKVYESYDEAGRITFSQYDFKGNVLSKMREVVKDDVLEAALDVYTNFTMDWDNAPALSLMQFVTDMRYDALNRVTELILPTDLDAERKKIRPAYNKAGALEKVDLYSTAGGGTTTNYVENITYNAKGQRLLIAFGNGIMTRYVYDPFTFRLIRQRSEKYARTQVGSTITYSYVTGKRQDDGFQYDLVGNIVKLLDRMKDCGIGGTPDTLDRTFEYDPLYRLTYADGRESSTQHENSYLYQDAPAPVDLTHVRAYSRTYSYNKLGNVLHVVQAGTNGFTRHYNYTPGKNTLDEINDGASSPVLIEDYTYDANGNQITAGASRYYSWNHSDQLICYKNQAGGTPTVYTQYDYAGQDRVSKLVRTGTSVSPIYERTVYIDGIFEYVKLKNTSSIYEKNYIHIMDDKSRIAEVRIGDVFPGDITDSVTFIIESQIGSSVMRTDGSGTEIDREEYYPFGDSSLRTFIYKRYRYVGKERDAESGLYYYGARYYAAWTCRFISCDPKAAQFPNQSSYNYCFNNPINLNDPSGMAPEGGDDPPNNNIPATNGNAANKLASVFEPAKGQAYDGGRLPAAGTDGGAGATKMQNLKVGPVSNDDQTVGHQYPKGTFESKAADPTPRAAANNNTTGLAGDASNPAPTDAQLLEEAAEMLPSSPEIQIGKGAISGSTSGDLTAGIQKNDANLSANLFTGEMNKVGAGGVMVSSESLEYGPYAVSNSINTTTRTNIQHDAALTPTAIVETSFIIQDRTAQLGGGISETKVTVTESKTLIPSGQVIPTTTIGEMKQKFITGGFEAYGFQFQFKVQRN